MNSKKYYDVTSIMQVIGTVFLKPELLDMEEKYRFCEDDFVEDFHRTIFGAIYNTHKLGAEKITTQTIEDYLVQFPKKYGTYEANNGTSYLEALTGIANPDAFDFYYNKMKKLTLLRQYAGLGLRLDDLYDPDTLSVDQMQSQEEWLNSVELMDIAAEVDAKVEQVKIRYAEGEDGNFEKAGNGVLDLIEELKRTPEVGYPLYGNITNTIHRGARLSKLYLRSAPSGYGKSRMMIADACSIGCEKIYDKELNEWRFTGEKENVLFITTELDVQECQTMCLAFLSGVNEEHIINGRYEKGEEERVIEAGRLLLDSGLLFKQIPDFTIKDIDNAIKIAIRERKVKYAFFDYIHSSPRLLQEIGGQSGVKGLREDNVLFLLASKLKDIAVEQDIFILTSTQLNGDYKTSKTPDQNLLRGQRA
jgi:replicative DNA helicase